MKTGPWSREEIFDSPFLSYRRLPVKSDGKDKGKVDRIKDHGRLFLIFDWPAEIRSYHKDRPVDISYASIPDMMM
jgi:hypothetical protein